MLPFCPSSFRVPIRHVRCCSSLIQNCCAKLLCCDTSCLAISSPNVKWISCYNPNTRILFAPWFKTALQNYFVVILHVLPFQVQMSNECHVTIPTHESCSLFDSKLLFSMTLWWYFMSCHFKSRCQMNLLLQSQHTNHVRFLIHNYFAVWHCGDTSSPALSSPDFKLNNLSQSQHMNPVCSLI